MRTARRLLGTSQPVLVRMDSAFYGRGPVHAALSGGAAVSVTGRMDARVKAAITTIGEDTWTTIEYTDAVFDETTRPVDLAGRGRRDRLHRVRRTEEG